MVMFICTSAMVEIPRVKHGVGTSMTCFRVVTRPNWSRKRARRSTQFSSPTDSSHDGGWMVGFVLVVCVSQNPRNGPPPPLSFGVVVPSETRRSLSRFGRIMTLQKTTQPNQQGWCFWYSSSSRRHCRRVVTCGSWLAIAVLVLVQWTSPVVWRNGTPSNNNHHNTARLLPVAPSFSTRVWIPPNDTVPTSSSSSSNKHNHKHNHTTGGVVRHGRWSDPRIPPPIPDPQRWGPHAEQLDCLVDDDDASRRTNASQSLPVQVPHAILLGVMKGGTQALTMYLSEHAHVATARGFVEPHYFDRRLIQTAQGIPQGLNRHVYQRQLEQRYHDSFSNNKNRHNKIVIDDTPYLLAGGDRMARAILCIAPWTKWIVLLRNPMDRIESQYRYYIQGQYNQRQRQHKRQQQREQRERQEQGRSETRSTHYNTTTWTQAVSQAGTTTTTKAAMSQDFVDWETWIQADLQLLYETGVLRHSWTNQAEFDAFAGSDAERKAWRRYILHPRGCQLIVGKSLYAIQLDLYWAAMDQAGKPRSDLLILQSETLKTNTQAVYHQVLEHLHLAPHTLHNPQPRHVTRSPVFIPPMPRALRHKLEAILQPYQDRLLRQLGWNATVWTTTTNTTTTTS